MAEIRRLSIAACFLIVLLRMSIGWQFLYEGLWKLNSLGTAKPWSAAGYLKNSQGPFRDHFRNLTGDPDDLDWLNVGKVAARWDGWQRRFVKHYGLDELQQRRLNDMINGPKDFRAVLEKLPEGVQFRGSLGKAIQYNAKSKRLIVPGNWHLIRVERDRLLAMVTVEENPSPENVEKNEIAKAFQKAVNEVFKRASRLSIKDRLVASLKGDPSRAGLVQERHKGTIDYKRPGKIELYKQQLERYKQLLSRVEEDFQYEHLRKMGLPGFGSVRQQRAALAGPIKALDREMKKKARELLNEPQLKIGPVRLPRTKIDSVNHQTIWALTIIGILLIVGLFSRLSALAGAALLMLFYLAFPPWPGVIDFVDRPGPEHSYIVDKNLIEVFVLLAVAAMPTGRWFGLDALVRRYILRRKTD